jgi:type III secretion system low calcium response chaperone LcrH/SycD
MKLKELIARIAENRKSEFPLPENLEAYLEDFIPNTLLKSETLQRAFQVSSYEMEEIYREAYGYYYEDNYLESSTAFRWLILLNPFIGKYWMGLAASSQLLKKYEKALHAYAMAALIENENPYPHFHAYECYKALNNRAEGDKALACAYTKTLGKTVYRPLQEEIEKIKKIQEVPCQ